MGGNPQASQGSLLACPDILGEIDASATGAAGRSSSTRAAPAPPTAPTSGSRSCPGTDAAFLLAIVQRALDAEGLIDLGALEGDVRGRRRGAGASPRSSRPSRSRPSAASPPSTIRASPATLAAPNGARVYGRIGLCNQEFGTLASWLVDVVNTS